VVKIMVEHRRWKHEQIRTAKLEHLQKHFGPHAKEEWLECLEQICDPTSPFIRR
jgi:truncated hemoglobin YjbI